MTSIYDAKSYVAFIQERLDSPEFGRGARVDLAKHMGVQTSLISLVLTGRQHFVPEHGIKIAGFFDLDEKETHWLILLMHRDRAGTAALRKHYENQMSQLRQSRSEIQEKLKTKRIIQSEELNDYYGSWIHIAVHMCLRVSSLNSPDSIASYLRISKEAVRASLKILQKIRFVQHSGGKWRVLDQRFHLEANSLALRSHHINWRQMATHALDEAKTRDLHYSSVMSIDAAAAEKIRVILLESIQNAEPHIRYAKDERVYALTLDLFQVGET